jgi:hypothetical protein
MEKRIPRFKHCDSRFHAYLEKVFERLPEEIKEDVLSNERLQFVADDDFHEMCVSHFAFDHPVEQIVYLNTRTLTEPEHRIIYVIAHGIARYSVGKTEVDRQEKDVEDLLIHWGFEKELEAVRYCRAIAESEGYKIGYEWAKKQNKDYLMQHFGLYFDEWNEKGPGRMSREHFEQLHDQTGIPSILARIPQPRKGPHIEAEKDRISEVFTPDEAIIAGIMAAAREINLRDLHETRACST